MARCRLMEKFKLFTAFYHLSELRSREDLIKGIIQNLDYSMYGQVVGAHCRMANDVFSDGHSRIVLSKALTSSYKVGTFVLDFISLSKSFFPAYPGACYQPPRRTDPSEPSGKFVDTSTTAYTIIRPVTRRSSSGRAVS